MPEAVLGLGSNLGARRALFSAAYALLEGDARLSLRASSPLYHTPPLGPPQPDYLNAAVRVTWQGEPRALLAHTQHIEQLLRRQRSERWGPRTLDIDILHWSEGPLAEPGLTVPHPELTRRAFALGPLLAVLPELTPSYGAALSGLGGAPAHSEPVEARFELVHEEARTAASSELCEQVSAFAGALASFARVSCPASAVAPFVLPATLDQVFDAMEHAVREAFAGGFWVSQAAVTEADDASFAGVLVGAVGKSPIRLPILAREIAQNGTCVRVWRGDRSAMWP